ncbi:MULTISPECIES: GntR family transcriptional regulator [unclassified Chelatococcus]|uniref:GntR family transcriptional regulator n=1 Tax=unclassified Chelatococcus TaxID=2638111 RepID=UPI001BCE87F8|nr:MULTISPECIES: GntR family transcriptional regulator [unclassified Chelatococcus]CAH1652296.1 GntR family transcriptional regulator [Hyphomicrobiales bacterium]MBS7743053.1 GntR family transcriptional regulator [Chelatococcus sp. HY11]MBX3541829.1 GntR family transcriptional regulator [Chelatococcus sp.]MCO5074280.1 GntR family transcriptional regulator [Chelatococcus sp.]CAH1693767.1 GntR family transcriptional regulator [Hyphomicrobiales bacterium]
MDVNLGQIESATIQVQVYRRLREALFTGMFAPGEALTIRRLADILGTSPMPVREALQRLVAEHVLVQMPNRTFRVTPFSPEMFRELVRVRMTIEGFAAGEAARRATPAQLTRLSELNEKMAGALDVYAPAEVMTANREFHFALYEMTEMPQLLDIINGLWLRAGPYLMNAHKSLENPRAFFASGVKFHTRVIDSCVAREPRRAARALACDIWHSARNFRLDVARINDPGQIEREKRRRAETARQLKV